MADRGSTFGFTAQLREGTPGKTNAIESTIAALRQVRAKMPELN